MLTLALPFPSLELLFPVPLSIFIVPLSHLKYSFSIYMSYMHVYTHTDVFKPGFYIAEKVIFCLISLMLSCLVLLYPSPFYFLFPPHCLTSYVYLLQVSKIKVSLKYSSALFQNVHRFCLFVCTYFPLYILYSWQFVIVVFLM